MVLVIVVGMQHTVRRVDSGTNVQQKPILASEEKRSFSPITFKIGVSARAISSFLDI